MVPTTKIIINKIIISCATTCFDRCVHYQVVTINIAAFLVTIDGVWIGNRIY
jgi:hypothetical protein